jgi:tungstate transport system permease protein
MNEFSNAFRTAFRLLGEMDPDLIEIVLLSLRVSLSAVVLAATVALPLGAFVALKPFPGRRGIVILMNALMSLPPVVVGLAIYLLLSRTGPFGITGLLFTPAAMIIAQCVLVLPIIAALTRQTVSDLHEEYDEYLRSLGAGTWRKITTLLWDGRVRLLTGILAGFGRAIAEVGAVIIVGGNIVHSTRVMTTTIALETSKGDLGMALGLGIILVFIAIAVNTAVVTIGGGASRRTV